MELKCLSASGQLGYGIPEPALRAGVARRPDMIGADMGSIDPGPYFLGSGRPAVAGASLVRDLELVLGAARELDVPLLIGSAGTAGARPQLDLVTGVLKQVAKANGLSFTLATIAADIDRRLLTDRSAGGRVRPCGHWTPLDPDSVAASTNVVAQMGVEPFQRALEAGAQVILAGRSCDTSMFAAVPRMRGFDPGLAMHMAKIIECTSLCAVPGGRDASLGTIGDGWFTVESMNPARRCTPTSVAAHSMYEQPDPFVLGEPGGVLTVRDSTYEAVGDRTVRVCGSTWQPGDRYEVKVEGARLSGFRCISIGGMRDPRMIASLDLVIAAVRDVVSTTFAGRYAADDYSVRFREYGRGAVLEHDVALAGATPAEALVIIDVVGRSEEIARSVCGVAKQYLLHEAYPGMLCTSGNMAIPFGPDVIAVGDVYEFSVYHLMELDSPVETFPVELEQV